MLAILWFSWLWSNALASSSSISYNNAHGILSVLQTMAIALFFTSAIVDLFSPESPLLILFHTMILTLSLLFAKHSSVLLDRAIAKTWSFSSQLTQGVVSKLWFTLLLYFKYENHDLLTSTISHSIHWIHKPHNYSTIDIHTDYSLSNFNHNKITNVIRFQIVCMHPPLTCGNVAILIYSRNDALNSSSLAYSLTLRGYGRSGFNGKSLLSGNSPLIKLGTPGDCNSYNYFLGL